MDQKKSKMVDAHDQIIHAHDTILTGDRPTGPLHLGHYVGSLANRVRAQSICKQFVMIADVQALTDNVDNPGKVHDNVLQVMLDYLAVGIDPVRTTIFIQSQIPAIAELTMYYLNLVTIARLKRNPTIKTEIHARGFGEAVPAGFLMYPVSQAADITAFQATLVPAGEDQAPIIEQTNEIVRAFNRIYGADVLSETRILVTNHARLSGTDGKGKMSKSAGNAIFLSDEADVVVAKVKSMYTDPEHIQVSDPGKIAGNVVFEYLDAFGTDMVKITEFKEQYQRGGLGDMVVKRYLVDQLEAFLAPIRQRRKEYAADVPTVMQLLKTGTQQANVVAQGTLLKVKESMKLIY
jgi:tryptophanyl-tRNA synthetase